MRRLILIAALAALVAGCASEAGSADTDTSSSSTSNPTDPTVAESSSTSETQTGPTTETDPGTETEPTTDTDDTTGPTGCQGPDDCNDAALPFCVDDVCVACSATAEPDASCAQLEKTAPLCVEDACVQCSAEDADACGDITPLCDADANSCVACEFHEQCQDIGSPACNFVTGACFDAAAVTEVNAGAAGTIQTAVNAVADGAERAIVLTGGGQLHTITIDGGKTIAIVSNSAATREIAGIGDAPELTVSGPGTTAFLHRVWFSINPQGVGISVENEAHLYADSSRITPVFSDGGIVLAAGTTGQLRNCMVAGEGGNPGTPAITSNGAELDIIYSTLGLDFNNGGPTLECTGGAVAVRNSIVASDSSVAGSASQCPGADVANSLVDNDSGADAWFENMSAGDYRLTAAGQTQFADIAIWEDGDPPFDFEGDARPATDGSPDFPGADTIP